MSEETVLRALDIILERRHYPILMLCAQGTHRTSTVVGCLRKLQVILPTAPGVSNEGGEFGTLGSLAGCFLALGSGLGPVGTVSARR